MTQYEFISNYRYPHPLVESFNQLAIETFELSFSSWYERGYWDTSYIPYSFVDNHTVIANASVSLSTVIINGRTLRAIQIGTVMTRPTYREQGLAKLLIQKIIADYQSEADIIYLFANETVLDFYPKFGFTPIKQSLFWLNISESSLKLPLSTHLRLLDIKNEQDLKLIERLVHTRSSVSTKLGMTGASSLLMFYIITVFPHSLYYHDTFDSLLIMETTGTEVDIFDIVTPDAISTKIEPIIEACLTRDSTKVTLHFTPVFLLEGLHSKINSSQDDVLFVLKPEEWPLDSFIFPATGHC